MHASLVRIGNSQGVRLPKIIVEQAGLTKDLELVVQSGGVLIRAARTTREGWAEAAAELHEHGGDDVSEWDATLSDGKGLL